MKDILREKATNLPQSPGVYIMREASGKIIYIGKAKSLKNRVISYFNSDHTGQSKVRSMVEHIHSFDYIITDSEFEALVLECSMIKQHQPKYNILLKDDKGYNYVKISSEPWPRLTYTKKRENDGALYLGPYTSSQIVKNSVNEVRKIFKLPSCTRVFTSQKRTNVRPCLNYYINQCSAPCAAKISRQAYTDSINEAIAFLKSGYKASVKTLIQKMQACSENLEFELAASLRDKITAIKKIQQKQKVVNIKSQHQDVISFATHKDISCFTVFRFCGGSLCDTQHFILRHIEDPDSAQAEFILQYYLQQQNIPPLILLGSAVQSQQALCEWLSRQAGKKVTIKIPQKGEQFKILKMCENNAQENLLRHLGYKRRNKNPLKALQTLLNLETTLNYIEAYDVSNINGQDNVGAMVVFKDGKPYKKAYRKFKIERINNDQDDYASMKEMLNRRINEYENLNKNQNAPDSFAHLPSLILLDGGKGHVSVVQELLNSRGYGNLPLYGMVKDAKHRTRALVGIAGEISLKQSDSVYSFITQIQDEVHRFAIGYHHARRKKHIGSTLLLIQGVGKTRAKLLLGYFKSIQNIKNASLQELLQVPSLPKSAAESIYNYFRSCE